MQTMPNITMVTDANFDSVVAESQKPVLLAIGAQWCPDCRRLQPLFMHFAKDYSDKLVFASCDFDNNPGIKEKFDVRHIPVFVVLKDGQPVDTLIEPKSIAPFKEFVEKAVV